jgi:hypothetical protein
VPKYDAFGREIGENTLAGLGGDSSAAQPAPRAEPEVAPQREAVTREPAAEPRPEPERVTFSVPEGAPITVVPGRRRRSSGLGCLIGVVILGAIIAGPVIGIVSFVGSATDVLDDITDAVDPETLELPEGILPPPVGVTGDSMIARDKFAAALDEVRGAGYARATGIDLRPDRVTFTVVRNGRQRDLRIGYESEMERGTPSPANTAAATFGLAAVDPAAPALLVRGAARRYRVKPKGINYVLAGPETGGGHHWRAYFKNGVYVEGDAAGRVIRRFDGG